MLSNLPSPRWSLAVIIGLLRLFTSVIDELFDVLAVGAAFGTSKSGIGIAGLGQFKPELIMKVRTNTIQFQCVPPN
jgi:hypothetical protein